MSNLFIDLINARVQLFRTLCLLIGFASYVDMSTRLYVWRNITVDIHKEVDYSKEFDFLGKILVWK
jgi:hypothetical protein